MGQKVNPHGLRVGVIKEWDSRWFEKDETFGDTLVSDYKIRKFLKEKLKAAGVPRIEIERTPGVVRVLIHCSKPGQVIGRGGSELDKLREEIQGILGDSKKTVVVNIAEIKTPDLNAQLVAESIASQLEKRIAFRRAMKQAIGRTMRLGAKGIKVSLSGRLGGAEIARSEHYHEGTIPLQTLRADIDYGFTEANTTYGKIGVKVWIYNGVVLLEKKNTVAGAQATNMPRDGRRFNRDRGDRRNNDNRGPRPGFQKNQKKGDRKPAFKQGTRPPKEGGKA